jgi:hypothetical protein
MRSFIIFSFVALGCVIHPSRILSQHTLKVKPHKPIICYQSFENNDVHIGVSERLRTLRDNSGSRVKTAKIEVEYVNFPADNLAKNAFEYAVNIWEAELISSVPIRIRAEWKSLASGVLGQAIWGSAYANFGGEQHVNTFYPVALAEKITGREINGATEPDIVASFNSNASWYFGTEGNTPSGKMDMVTIVLHEIAHGLGFTDTYDVEEGEGSVGLANDGDSVPFIFDVFVENRTDQNLLFDFQSPSAALATQLQSSDIFFDSPLAVAALKGVRPELYAPSTFDNGSSISHLDESIFNNQTDANRLMTPQIGFAESIHEPGSVLMAMLADIGWVYTSIDHEPLSDTERKDGRGYVVVARIRSDNGYDPASVKIHYTSDGNNYTIAAMVPTGIPDEFKFTLPATTVDKAYSYFIAVTDTQKRIFTNPGKIQEPGKKPEQGTHFFSIGTDLQAPVIVHEPVPFISENAASLKLSAEVTDNLGVKELIVEYAVNGGAIHTAVMPNDSADIFSIMINLPALTIGDEVRYRFVARDLARQENIGRVPEEGFFLVQVTGIMPLQESYSNDFNQPTDDFFGNGFSVQTPMGFDDGAIHSEHPYHNGSGPNNQSNYIYQLQVPIRIGDANPTIRFDEIVLVEPGEDGSAFGDGNFFDFVIVEGSRDAGASWEPFAPGYDSRDDSQWLARYKQQMVNDNSQSQGDPALFRTRTINMLESDNFSEGDEVLIRFRLFADQFAYGWGWAIDNLSIQSPVTSSERPLTQSMLVYPSPVSTELHLKITNPFSGPVHLSITNLQGAVVYSQRLDSSEAETDVDVDVSRFADGLYIVKVAASGQTLVRKFTKAGR